MKRTDLGFFTAHPEMTTRALKSRVVKVIVRHGFSLQGVGAMRQCLLFIVLHFLELCINHIVSASGFGLRAATCGC